MLPAWRDLRRRPFAPIHDLRPTCCQSPENTQVLFRQPPARLWPEQHEPRDELGVDPVGLCPRAPGKGESFNLCRGQLHSLHPCRHKRGPEHPLLTARCFKSNPHRLGQGPEQHKKLGMARCAVGEAEMLPARRTAAVEPIAGNIYADHGGRWYHITLSSLCFAVPQNRPPSTVRDGEERRDQPASDREPATRCSALMGLM